MLTDQEMREAILRLTKERNDLAVRCEDMERSANSAREIARVAMSHTSTECIRVELTVTAYGLRLIVCAPADDEKDITLRIASFLNPAIVEALGMSLEKAEFIGATS